MSENWVRIGKSDYSIKSDRLNWVVARRVKCENSKSYPDGFKHMHETYHPELRGAFKRIFEETIKLADAATLQDILGVCEETYAMLKRALEYDFKDFKSAA
jgi:hypothetical protein